MDQDRQADRVHWILKLKEMSFYDASDAAIGLLVFLGWVAVIVFALLGWIR